MNPAPAQPLEALGRDRRLYEVSRRNLAGSFVFSARAAEGDPAP